MARAPLMVGVNQVIMLSLNMVIIASMIGAGGLGYDVLTALRRLDIGAGLEAGLAITVLAIALDRLSQAAAGRSREGGGGEKAQGPAVDGKGHLPGTVGIFRHGLFPRVEGVHARAGVLEEAGEGVQPPAIDRVVTPRIPVMAWDNE